MFLVLQIAEITKTAVFVYASFIFMSVYSYTSLMDKSRYAWHLELLRLFYALFIINFYGGWFTLDNFISLGTPVLVVYFIFSTIVSFAFDYFEFRTDTPLVEASA